MKSHEFSAHQMETPALAQQNLSVSVTKKTVQAEEEKDHGYISCPIPLFANVPKCIESFKDLELAQRPTKRFHGAANSSYNGINIACSSSAPSVNFVHQQAPKPRLQECEDRPVSQLLSGQRQHQVQQPLQYHGTQHQHQQQRHQEQQQQLQVQQQRHQHQLLAQQQQVFHQHMQRMQHQQRLQEFASAPYHPAPPAPAPPAPAPAPEPTRSPATRASQTCTDMPESPDSSSTEDSEAPQCSPDDVANLIPAHPLAPAIAFPPTVPFLVPPQPMFYAASPVVPMVAPHPGPPGWPAMPSHPLYGHLAAVQYNQAMQAHMLGQAAAQFMAQQRASLPAGAWMVPPPFAHLAPTQFPIQPQPQPHVAFPTAVVPGQDEGLGAHSPQPPPSPSPPVTEMEDSHSDASRSPGKLGPSSSSPGASTEFPAKTEPPMLVYRPPGQSQPSVAA